MAGRGSKCRRNVAIIGMGMFALPRAVAMEHPPDDLTASWIVLLVVLVLALGIYLLPTSVAAVRQHRHLGAVFVLNLFLGWTLLGWVGALVWALTAHRDDVMSPQPEARQATPEPPPVAVPSSPRRPPSVNGIGLIVGGGIGVAGLIIAIVALSRTSNTPSTANVPPAPASVPAPVAKPTVLVSRLPTANELLRSVYRTTPRGGVALPSPNLQATLWRWVRVQDRAKVLDVAMLAEQSLDDQGKVEDCHACAVNVTVVTFENVTDGWLESEPQRALFPIGQWGKQPNGKAFMTAPTAAGPIVFIEDDSAAQGYSQLNQFVLARIAGRWIGAGNVQLGEDDAGNCGPETIGGDPACWSYSSTVGVSSELQHGLPVLILTRRGTMSDGRGHAKAADGTVRVVFNGATYETDPPDAR